MNTSGNIYEIKIGLDDLSEIIQIDLAHFPHPWMPVDWNNLNPVHYLLYMWRSTKVEAFALFHRVGGDETAHLLKICVLPSHQGTGVAQNFWTHLVADLRMKTVQSVFLEVEKTNLNAIHFYQKSAFVTLREIRGYYSGGGSALTMKLTL